MIFIALVIMAIVLHVFGYKMSAMFLFFFFITSGFNLVPEEVTRFIFISKGIDFAFLIMLGILIIDSIFIKDFMKPDSMTKFLLPLAIFLVVCMAYSKFVLGISLSEIIRSSRYLFFWAAWFIFRNLNHEQLNNLLKGLFIITLFTSILYILQLFFETDILNKTFVSKAELFGMKLRRYYNHPDMLYFFTFFAIYCNPWKGGLRVLTIFITVLALVLAFHRNLTGFFLIAIGIVWLIRLPRLKRITVLTVSGSLLLMATVFFGYRFVHSRTYTDIKNVLAGNFMDIDTDLSSVMQEGTFTFRMAHLLERTIYLQEHPRAMIIGAGLMTEDSKKTQSLFGFNVGLAGDATGETVQLDSADISYSVLSIRFGYLGTFVILLPIIVLMVFFYKRRGNNLAVASFSYLVLVFGSSFFSGNLMQPITFLMPVVAYHIVCKEKKIPQNTIDDE
ncbi:MAG: hypothetical protein LBF79_04965 [Dysgonamonadaceae bacterium]|jgi:hypothetical protein|nr:hypothetical protein [Dysgonamonadaceae bacterium]